MPCRGEGGVVGAVDRHTNSVNREEEKISMDTHHTEKKLGDRHMSSNCDGHLGGTDI